MKRKRGRPKKPVEKRKIHFATRLNPNLLTWLRDASEKSKTPMSEIVEKALIIHLVEHFE